MKRTLFRHVTGILMASLFLLTLVCACGGALAEGEPSLRFEEAEISIPVRYTARVTPVAENVENPRSLKYVWTSDDEQIATVQNGTVKGVSAGDTVITCSTELPDGKQLSCTLTAHIVEPVKSVSIQTRANTKVDGGETLAIEYTVQPENATDPSLTWESSDPDIATVDSFGVVTAVAAGKVNITATTNDGSKKQARVQLYVPAMSCATEQLDVTEPEGASFEIGYYGADWEQNVTVKVTGDAFAWHAEQAGNTVTVHVVGETVGSGKLDFSDKKDPAGKFSVGIEIHSEAVPLSRQDPDLMDAVLTALDKPACTEALAALQGGEVVTRGATGEAATGLQQALADLGFSVEVTGTADQATMEALNKLMTSLGMKKVTQVDASVYAELLKLLLAATDEDAARDVMADAFGADVDTGAFMYLLGSARYSQGKYYSAMKAFESCEYRDWEKRASACVQTRPRNGEMWHNPDYVSNEAILIFSVNAVNKNDGYYFKVFAEDGTYVSSMFVNGSGRATAKLPGGIYKIMDAKGETWFGTDDLFGPEGEYEYMVFDEYDDDKYKTLLEAGYYWTITINTTGSEGGTGVGGESLDWDDLGAE